MEKGLGTVVIVLIWGSALYFLAIGIFGGEGSLLGGKDNFFASAVGSFERALNTKSDVLGFFENGNYSESFLRSREETNVRNISVSPINKNKFFASSDNGLFVSEDGALNWESVSSADFGTDVRQVSFGSGGIGYVSVYKEGKGIIYHSSDDFLTSGKLLEINGKEITTFDLSEDEIYLGLSGGEILSYSLSGGRLKVLSSLPSSITGISVGRENRNLIYSSVDSGGFYASANRGKSFARMEYLDKYRGADKINQFLISSFNDRLLYAATGYGLIRSADGGKTWKVFKSLPSEKTKVSFVYYDPESSKIYASSNEELYVNVAGSSVWKTMDPDLGKNISAINSLNGKIIIGTKD